MQYSYVILDDDSKSILKIKSVMDSFSNFVFVGTAPTYKQGLELVLELQPDFVFLEVAPIATNSQLNLSIINEWYRFLKKVPKVIAMSSLDTLAIEAVKYDVLDFLIKPFSVFDIRKCLLRYEKNHEIPVIKLQPPLRKALEIDDNEENVKENVVLIQQQSLPINQDTDQHWMKEFVTELKEVKEVILKAVHQNISNIDYNSLSEDIANTIKSSLSSSNTTALNLQPVIDKLDQISASKLSSQNTRNNQREVICIKSYGDYRFLELDTIAFLKADNNSTDITLHNNEQVTAFKTLKYFEEHLPDNFFRIHNSYIVNKNFISRIHTGNSLCYIKNSKHQIPFSKSYKDQIEQIISHLAGSDFKE